MAPGKAGLRVAEINKGPEPVPLAEGVKCPHCLEGVFRLKTKVLSTSDGTGSVQVWFWTCSTDTLLPCRQNYYPDHSEMEGAYFAVLNGRVKIIRRGAKGA